MDPHQEAIRSAAERLGVRVRAVEDAPELLVLEHGDRAVTVACGRRLSFLRADVEAICDDKAACKAKLASLGIPVPAGIVVDRAEPNQAAIEAHLARGVPQAMKPLAGTHGEHVALGLRTLEEVLAHVEATPEGHRALVLEDLVRGRDLRIQAVSGKLLAACVREPAFVVGNGVDTVRALAEARHALISRQNPENVLELDHESGEVLAEQGLGFDDVPAAGGRVRLKRVSNIARGGVAIDVTAALHPRYAEWVERIAHAFPIDLFAVDVMTESLDSDPERAAKVLEINARPEWLHHTFSEGRTHDVPAAIVRWLFEL